MATFTYRAKDRDGTVHRGKIESPTAAQARGKLKERQLVVLSLQEKRHFSLLPANSTHVKMGLKDKVMLTEQLAVMIKSGLSVAEALKAMVSEAFNPQIGKMLSEIATHIEGGDSFANALSQYERTFGRVYIQMIKAAEKSGQLDEILNRLAMQLQKDYEIRGKIRSALLYPAIIMVLMLCVIIVILVYVIPKLKTVFDNSKTELPATTQFLLDLSNFFLNNGVGLAITLVILFLLTKIALRHPRLSYLWDIIKLRIPIYGPFVKRVYLARFSLNFASLLSSGLPILAIFETTEGVVDNKVYQKELKEIANKIENGVPIAHALHESPYFPNMIAQLISVGEKSGSLDEVMWVVAGFYEKEVDAVTRNLSSTLEPIIMVVLGLGVAFILISVLQPMYGLVNSI